jgi:hypothetical protein
MSDLPRIRSCDEARQEIQGLHKKHIQQGWKSIPIPDDAIMHRLVRQCDIDPNTSKPHKNTFSDFGLSVYIEGSGFPKLDIRQEILNSNVFIAAIRLEKAFIDQFGFDIIHDPHNDILGNPQHSNHAQIICKKTQSITKRMRDCDWSVPP